MAKYIILLPPPCTNSDLHMGHLAGAFIPGDIYARYLYANGHKVIVVCAADQNNIYTEIKSQKINKSFDYTKFFFADSIRDSLSKANVNVDSFSITSSTLHIQTVQKIVEKLWDNKLLHLQSVPQLYCETCETYIFDAIVGGFCGNCYSESDGAICENCNTPRFNNRLVEPKHKVCNHRAVIKLTTSLLANISTIKNILLQLITASDWNERLKLKYKEYLCREELENIILSYHYEYGIKIEKENLEANSVTIWFEAIWSCFTALLENNSNTLDELLEELSQPDTHLIPFMGEDSEFYYAIAFSAVLLGLGINKIPYNLSVQRFVKLNGKKFSSSKNNIITIDQLIDKYPVDIIRLYSISILNSYFDNTNDFNEEELEKLYRAFVNFEEELYKHCKKFEASKSTYNCNKYILNITSEYFIVMNKLAFGEVYRIVSYLIDFIIKNRMEHALNLEICCCLLMLKPIMPNTIEKMGLRIFGDQWSHLNLEKIINGEIIPIFKISKKDEKL